MIYDVRITIERKMKFWQKENDTTTAVLKFYGEIYRWWNGAMDFTNTIEEIEKKYSNLEIRLHCYGGEVFEGNVIFNALQRTKLNITWYVDGVAASMGGYIPFAKGKVVMAENAFWMIHVPTGYTVGNSKDHFNQAKLLKTMEANFANAYKRKTGKSDADVSSWLDGGDHWFGSAECLAMKIADEISTPVDTTGVNTKPDNGTPAQDIYSRFTALASAVPVTAAPVAITTPSIKQSNMDKGKLITSLGLTGVTAESSDTAIEEAIIAKGKNDATKIENLNKQISENTEAVIVSLISGREAELQTTFTEEQKKNLNAVAKAGGVESLKAALACVSAVPNLAEAITPEAKGKQGSATAGKTGKENFTYDDYQEKDPTGWETLVNTNKAHAKKLYVAKFGEASAADFE